MATRRWRATVMALVVLCTAFTAPRALAQELDPATTLTVVLGQPLRWPLEGVTQAVVLDEDLADLELVPGGVQITGVRQGDTVLLAWRDEHVRSVLVRIVLPAPRVTTAADAPAVTRSGNGRGEVATSAQVVQRAGGATSFFQQDLNWRMERQGRWSSVRLQRRDSTVSGVPGTLSALSLGMGTPRMAVTLVDFSLQVNGTSDTRVPGYSPNYAYVFWGGQVEFLRGATRVATFLGASLPTESGRFAGDRRLGGLNMSHRFSPALALYGTTGGLVAPAGTEARRRASVFQTAGLSFTPGTRWATQLTAGASNRGGYGEALLRVAGTRGEVRLTGTVSAAAFPLTQLQLLAAGGRAAAVSAYWLPSARVSTSVSASHNETLGSGGARTVTAASDYVSPNLSLMLSPSNTLVFNAGFSRQRGDATPATTFDHGEIGWHARVGGFSSTLQAGLSRTRVGAGDRDVKALVRHNVSIRIPRGTVGIQWQRAAQDPSLALRVRQQLGLLSPDLQDLFLRDPSGFLASPDLPPNIRQMFGALRSTDTQATVSTQLTPWRRLTVSASYDIIQQRRANLLGHASALTYAATWQITPWYQLRSSVADTYGLAPSRDALSRNRTIYVGLSRSWAGGARLMGGSLRRDLVGRVFLDRDVNGRLNAVDDRLSGIVVRLDNGRTTTTDASGEYRFLGLSEGLYRVTVPLDQFDQPVRLTTSGSVMVPLSGSDATVDFGIVNFARLLGTVFNDVDLSGGRGAGARGLQQVKVVVTDGDGFDRTVATDAGGQFEVLDLPPGEYQVTVDPITVPPNYMRATVSMPVTVTAARTSLVDLPIRAMRSVSGYVYLRSATSGPAEPVLLPVSGVVVVAGPVQAVTDATGRFMLRGLPAGDLTVTLRPTVPLPPGLEVPTGRMRLPADPVRFASTMPRS